METEDMEAVKEKQETEADRIEILQGRLWILENNGRETEAFLVREELREKHGIWL